MLNNIFKSILAWVKSLHLHSWDYKEETYLPGIYSEELCLEATPATRTCSCCGKVQVRERHCLGLNPPEYTESWHCH